MKKITLVSSITLSALIFAGCSGGTPKPSADGKKPTVFVESHTAEKFKNITEENADAKGISSMFVKDKQYMRCDILPETVAAFAREGFDIVHDKQKADYTAEVTLLSCGQGTEYFEYRNATPPKGKELYKRNLEQAQKYLQRTKGIVLPNKYYNMPDEDKEALENYLKEEKIGGTSSHIATSGHINGIEYIGKGVGSGNAATAGIGLAFGLISMVGGVENPHIHNEFKITNSANNKSWSKVIYINPYIAQDWRANINKPVHDWTVDEIPWSELD